MTGRERKPQTPNVEYQVRQKTDWQDSGAPSGSLYEGGGMFSRDQGYQREPKKGGGDAAPCCETNAPTPV